MISKSACGSTPERVVDLVDNVGCTNHAVVEVATVESLESFLAARYGVKLDVDIALGVGVDCDVDNGAVLLGALRFYLSLQLLNPAVAEVLLLPALC